MGQLVKLKDESPISKLLNTLSAAQEIVNIAKRHTKPLIGSGFYARKFSEKHIAATLSLRELKRRFDGQNVLSLKVAIEEIETGIENYFKSKDGKGGYKTRSRLEKEISFVLKTKIEPALAETANHVPTDELFPLAIVRSTRPYIERIAEQACGSYDQSWYDACAVMCRRLLETLIIECFEKVKLSHRIKDINGKFFYLDQLIVTFLSEPSWNVSRYTKQALPRLKDLGNLSAHDRFFTAHKPDVDKIKNDLRITIEALVHISGLKKW